MKYGLVFKKNAVPEWQEMYLNYKLLKKLIKPFHVLSKVYLRINYSETTQKNPSKITITNVTQSDLEKLKLFNHRFEKLIVYEFEKINTFFEFKLMEELKRWRLFKINASILQNLRGNLQYELYKQQFQNAFQQFYKEIILLNEYLLVNQEGFRKIIKKFKKASKNFAIQEKNCDANFQQEPLKSRFEANFALSFIQKNSHKLHSLRSDIENHYLIIFYKKFNRKQGQNELRKISQGRIISQNESFFFGLFLGIALILILLICLLAWYGDLDVDDDMLFKDIFPMFRGIGAFILYVWLLAWNVYGWTTANINYKLIFGFNYHFSQVSEILKRAAFFTMLFLLMFLWYIILRQNLGKLADILAFLPKEFTPLVVWITFLGYLFFPSKKVLNPLGRIYSYGLFRDIFFRPFDRVSFKIAWSTDQLASFVGPLKDLEYTICYYSGDFFNETHVNFCQSKQRFSSGFVVAFIPLFLRILQCFRNMYDKKNYFGVDFLNCLKYVIALIVVVFSFLTTIEKEAYYLNFWMFFALISTFYSSFWDWKMDWGFLNFTGKNHLLRKTLSYEHKAYYYIAMSLNLLLRFGWTLSLSPDIVARIIRPEIFAFFIAFMEMLRRCIWNFFRVEKEHIQNCGIFKAVEDIVLPFENICFEIEMNEMRVGNNGKPSSMSFIPKDFVKNPDKITQDIEKNGDTQERGKNYDNPYDKKNELLVNYETNTNNNSLRMGLLEENSRNNSIKFDRQLSDIPENPLGIGRRITRNLSLLSNTEKISLFHQRSVMDITKDELRNRAQTEETYENVKREVDEFCREVRKNIEFHFKVFEEKGK